MSEVTERAGEMTTLSRVTAAIDALIAAGASYHGLIPSVLDVEDGTMPFHLPPAIAGQRECDRSFPGSNLMHDHVLLKLMYDLSAATGEARFADAADRYLGYFAIHCTQTPTGLFPWGEHAFWNILDDRVGSSFALQRVASMATHDHLLQAPAWLWEKLWSLNAPAVERFCRGLRRHFLDVDPPEYIRHANLLVDRISRNRGERSCDFPRHSGFYIFDWSFAFARTRSPMYRQFIVDTADYWWTRRTPGKPLAVESRAAGRFVGQLSVPQTLSLAVSLLESAALVEPVDTDLAGLLGTRGRAYLDDVLAVPHDLPAGKFLTAVDADTGNAHAHGPVWGSAYGSDNAPASSCALLLLCAYRLTGDSRLLTVAQQVGRHCADSTVPSDVQIPIKDAGTHLALLVDLYSLTQAPLWLDAADRWSMTLVPLFLDHTLPRGATGLSLYESQLIPAHFLRALARTALLRRGHDIGPDYTLR